MNKKIKALFIGLGSIGKRHLKNLSQIMNKDELSVHALRSNKSALDEDIKSLIDKEIYDFKECDNYDFIFITNPSYLHLETLEKVKSKAKAFFIEKPLDVRAMSEDEINSLDKDKIYYIAAPLRHKRAFLELQKLIKDKKIYCARAICSSYLPDWRKNADYRTIYSAKKESGGIKLDLIHEFDYLFELFNYPKNSTLVEKKLSNLEIETNDYLSFIGNYDDKVLELHLDYFGRMPKRTVEIYTDEEVIICDFYNSTITINDKTTEFKEDANTPYLNEMKYFLSLTNNKNMNDITKANEIVKFLTKKEK